METKAGILFTAFEPSGDEHAAPVIRELRAMLPDVPIHALGGPKMQAAGAQLIERTTGNAAMLGSAIAKIFEHRRLRRQLKRWLNDHPVAVHVPTDSPAANWGICKMTKRRGAKVVHLVAPQVWAWATWRVRRLKKWSDLVLCLLPFEPQWFARHGVQAKFIGHPLFDEPVDCEVAGLPECFPRIALLPGSRPDEVRENLPLMLEGLNRLIERDPNIAGVIAAMDAVIDEVISEVLFKQESFTPFKAPLEGLYDSVDTPDHPTGKRLGRLKRCVWQPSSAAKKILPTIINRTESVLEWADIVFTTSGTATLHIARHGKPMAILYCVNPLSWHLLGRWLVRTKTFTLPNLIAAGGPTADASKHIVKEFVPFTGGAKDVGPIVDELVSLIEDKEKARRQVEALRGVVKQFEGHNAGREAAEAIVGMYSTRA